MRRHRRAGKRLLAPVLSEQTVVARHPVAWLRLIVVCVAGSLLLTALYVWGLRDYIDQRRSVRDAQYQQTQQELQRQQSEIEQLQRGRVEDERRLRELERRLGVTPTPTPTPAPSPSLSASRGVARSGASTVPTVARSSSAAHPVRPSTRAPSAPSPTPRPSPPAGDDGDVPLLCLPLLGCL